MRDRRSSSPSLSVNLLRSSLIASALVALAARSARAEDVDSAPDAPAPAEPAPPAPPSAPAPTPAQFKPGLVAQLPATAYPEPVVRGLYGGSLWLNMQGLQWPYYRRTGIGVSGYAWLDNDYKRTRIGDPNQSDHVTKYFQQGRFLLRVTPTFSRGIWFVQAQGEIVGNKDQLDHQPDVVDTDDLWVRVGAWNTFDITVGRFEAFEVYHLGMGLDINTDERIGAYDGAHTPPQLYGATYLFYRPSGPGNIALHLYPFQDSTDPVGRFLAPLRVELLAQWGNDNTLNYKGGRPALIYDAGWLKLKVAAEYQWGTPQDPSPQAHNEVRKRGVAGSVQLVFAPWVELGVNAGASIEDLFTPSSMNDVDRTRSGNETSYGGFLNARVFDDFLVGVGGNYAAFHNLHQNAEGEYDRSTNTQYFVAIQYLVFHQLFLKLVGGYAKSHFEYSFSNMAPYDDDMYSVRLRAMYLF